MCGIFGIIGNYTPSKAQAALAKLSHRGPDFCGIHQKKDLFFAHQRLSIIDTHKRAHQPLQSQKILLSFNGEIYNFKELQKELPYPFMTQSDTEVILAAYKKWGVSFVTRLRGMFAIALLDGEKLYLFRDRLGKKPLFYLDSDPFVFASELKAIVPFLQKNELNDDALMSYLSFLAPTPPFTFFKGVKKLAAGEYLTYHNKKIEVKRYHNLLSTPPNIISDKEEAIEKLESLLRESIALRLHADVPIASLLSGGIDSATLNFFAKEQGVELLSYTLGYKEFSKYDERRDAKESANLLGIQNKAVEINQEDFLHASEKLFETMDEPINDPAAIPLYLLFKEIKKDGYKVVLSGEGSDELFLGYRHYFDYLDIQNAAQLQNKNWLKRYFKANYSPNREWEWYRRIFDETLLFRTSGEKFTDLQKNELLKRNVKKDSSLKYLNSYRDTFLDSAHTDESIWYSFIDLHLFQAEHFLTKLDRVSMAHSIEARTPFLDHKLVETLFSIAPHLRYEDMHTKSLLKKMMHTKIDTRIIARKKKGFANPYMEYLINSQKTALITEVNEQTGLFKCEQLQKYIEGAKTGAFKHHVWGLYVLSHWIKKNLL